ncbi:MAG: pyridoxal phosphate-dependent aminotransferase [Bacteroidales bacterium]|nr:pyridoxal phosphate-dependent aminotransferase [Lachnoclostridium sp.]MCM1383924.1 pyridoxal phosphate-dependent aminotransferase [Lachnoclostridium sp.]MCM1464633.1 pyridoxal phosphate-dependent aminotransferase [Bacteroidales bacterium]
MNQRLSDASERLFGQPMFQILSRIKELEREGESVIHFEIGDPDFDTPVNVADAGIKAIKEGKTHYSPAIGEYALREVIQSKNQEIRGFVPNMEQILVSPGANILIYFMVACIMNSGEEIILPDPCFSTYISVAKYCNVNPVFVPLRPEHEFRMQPEDVLKRITDKTRIVLLNSPHNPTGSVMLPEEMREIARICYERDIYVITDEIYRWLNYRDEKNYSVSIADECKEHILVVDGFSKSYAMTGWRLGYAIAPKALVSKMSLLLETLCSCAPSFIQYAGIEALLGPQDAVLKMKETYNRRRKLLVDGLNRIDGIHCQEPQGAFYVFPNIEKTGLTDTEFAKRLLEEAKVGVVAGQDFGMAGRGHIRLCYATDEEKIVEGLARIKQFVSNL